MAKLARKAYATYLDSTFGGSGTPSWYLIGKDIDDMSVSLNPDVSTKQNILGETSVEDNGYTPEMDADPYYADPTDSIYDKVKDIALQRLTGDDCKTSILEVIIEDTSATSHEAYKEDVIVKPQSYGGDTTGVNIPYNVYFNGNRTKGTVSLSNGVPTFTAAE